MIWFEKVMCSPENNAKVANEVDIVFFACFGQLFFSCIKRTSVRGSCEFSRNL